MNIPHKLILASTLLAAMLSAVAYADAEQSVRPGINRNFERPDWAAWVARFERPGRELYDRRHEIVAATGAGPGMAVADIGAGTGLHTRLFARTVGPAGRVYAVDIAPDFVANILRTAREQGLANVEGVVNTPKSAALPDASIDIAFVAATYHHFEYPQAMLASIRAALRPGARFFVIDFRKDPAVASPWVMGHVRTDRQAVIDEVTRAGFVFEGEPLRLWRDYMLAFRRAQD